MVRKHQLDKDGFDLSPIDITPDVWYYEERRGLSIYYDGNLIAIIPWRKAEKSVTHYQSYKANRPKKSRVAKDG